MSDDLYQEFINKLQKDKSEEEVGEFIANLLKFGSSELYIAMLTLLTPEDMDAINVIDDDVKADEEITKRFKAKTGKTPEEFLGELRDRVAKGYLFPVLVK